MNAPVTTSIAMLSLKDMVGGDKQVRFAYAFEGELWYVAENGFEFPVPMEHAHTARMHAQERAMLFMRYIRDHLQRVQAAHRAQDEQLQLPD